MNIFLQFIFSFIASTGFGVIANAPVKALPFCGFSGMVGWVMYWFCTQYGIAPTLATFIGAFFVALCSILFSRICKMPMTTFNIPGIFPLVPGVLIYQTVKTMISGSFELGLQYLIQTFSISFAIAMAIVVAEFMNRFIYRVGNKVKK